MWSAVDITSMIYMVSGTGLLGSVRTGGMYGRFMAGVIS